MLRRTWLKFAMGSLLVVFATRDWIVGRAHAADGAVKPKVAAQPTPTTAAAAIKSNDPDQVCAFVLTYPKVAAAAPLADKKRMLALLRISVGANGSWSAKALRFDQPAYEGAMVTLLRGSESRPAEQAQLIDALGGRTSVTAKIPAIQNAELRTLVSVAPPR